MFPKKNHLGLRKGKKKGGQLEFATLVSPGTGRDEEGALWGVSPIGSLFPSSL